MSVTLLFKSDNDRPEAWVSALKQAMPDLDVRVWPEIGEPEDITYALLWQPPDGVLGRCPNLKVILSLGAGVDHLIGDPELPDHLPIVRMVDPSLTDGMSEYVLFHTLRFHRDELRHHIHAEGVRADVVPEAGVAHDDALAGATAAAQ